MRLVLPPYHPKQALTRLKGTPDRHQYTRWFLGKSASSRWPLTSPHFPLLAWHLWVTWQERSVRVQYTSVQLSGFDALTPKERRHQWRTM